MPIKEGTNTYLSTITAEDRIAMVLKSKETRELKRKAGENLQVFTDEAYWRTLASKAGIRMPASYIPASEGKYLKRVLKKLNIDFSEWQEENGYKTIKQFAADNPTWSAVALIGLTLERYFEKLGEQDVR